MLILIQRHKPQVLKLRLSNLGGCKINHNLQWLRRSDLQFKPNRTSFIHTFTGAINQDNEEKAQPTLLPAHRILHWH